MSLDELIGGVVALAVFGSWLFAAMAAVWLMLYRGDTSLETCGLSSIAQVSFRDGILIVRIAVVPELAIVTFAMATVDTSPVGLAAFPFSVALSVCICALLVMWGWAMFKWYRHPAPRDRSIRAQLFKASVLPALLTIPVTLMILMRYIVCSDVR